MFITLNVIYGQSEPKIFTIDVSKPGAIIGPICRGQQIEEFNYQFQGGLYAQLINNPSFEELKNPIEYWQINAKENESGQILSVSEEEMPMLHPNQKRCLKLIVNSIASGPVGVSNGGYWGIKLENKTAYQVSFWAKKAADFNGNLIAKLADTLGKVYATSHTIQLSDSWQKFSFTLVTDGITHITGGNVFVIEATAKGSVYLDVVTLTPPTWKNRSNGLRPDLAQRLADLKFKYLQFPGGCTAESGSVDTSWTWKHSIGPLEHRKGSTRNRWDYKNDLYFGLDEYFQLCEDMGAEPIYTTSAGISESKGLKQWFKVCPLDKMQPIIDDILDLLEYCNGPATSFWGAKRAANGHPKPYNLKYLEIGNENAANWAGTREEYVPRYKMIREAILAKYPYIKFMYNGRGGETNFTSTDGNNADYLDEHFYLKDLSNLYNRYDSLSPDSIKICVAEYASSFKGNGGDVTGNFGDALNDAVFMLGCEKNTQKLWWTGYGNYAGMINHGNFGPCLVWNDAVTNFVTPAYYMQKVLFSDNPSTNLLSFTNNSKDCYLSASLDENNGKKDIILKAVNKSSKPTTINIKLKGAEKIVNRGIYTLLTAKLDDENTIEQPNKVKPSSGSFKVSSTFAYTFPKHSIVVLRISQQQ